MSVYPLHLLYFAWLRERIGAGEETIEAPDEIATLGQLRDWLRRRGPGFAAAFAEGKTIRAAVNQVFAGPETQLRPGDEVAFFPPLTGG